MTTQPRAPNSGIGTRPTNDASQVLDLQAIALLLNYERASTEPRFRYTKLREVAPPGSEFQTILTPAPEWHNARVPRTGFVFDGGTPQTEPDLPTNMLPPTGASPALRALTPTQLETYFYQARAHDACFASITLFQHFMDLFPPSTSLRIRILDSESNTKLKPREYTTPSSNWYILEMNLISPRSMNMSVVIPTSMTYITGGTPSSVHAVIGFAPPDPADAGVDTILDLASLQFGDAGRGFKGKGLFILESVFHYGNRLYTFAGEHTFDDAKMSNRINTHTTPNNAWLEQVARRAKARWENRENVPWCAHCGAPPRNEDLKRCSKCRKAWYCNTEHQRAAWPFHKHFCGDAN